MTCIAAVTDGQTVWMGGDSAGVDGWDLTVRRDPKVFRVGEFLIGFTSSFRMGQLLRCRLKAPKPARRQDLHSFMAGEFVDAVRACLKEGGFARKDEERESGGTFLVGFRGRLFAIEDDYQVGESDGPYDAVGCGAAYAKGALHALHHFDPSLCPSVRIHQALEAAERHSAGVRGPYLILTTTSPESARCAR